MLFFCIFLIRYCLPISEFFNLPLHYMIVEIADLDVSHLLDEKVTSSNPKS